MDWGDTCIDAGCEEDEVAIAGSCCAEEEGTAVTLPHFEQKRACPSNWAPH